MDILAEILNELRYNGVSDISTIERAMFAKELLIGNPDEVNWMAEDGEIVLVAGDGEYRNERSIIIREILFDLDYLEEHEAPIEQRLTVDGGRL